MSSPLPLALGKYGRRVHFRRLLINHRRYFGTPICNGLGADCTFSGCTTAFHQSGDTNVQVACQDDNVSSHADLVTNTISGLIQFSGQPSHYVL